MSVIKSSEDVLAIERQVKDSLKHSNALIPLLGCLAEDAFHKDEKVGMAALHSLRRTFQMAAKKGRFAIPKQVDEGDKSAKRALVLARWFRARLADYVGRMCEMLAFKSKEAQVGAARTLMYFVEHPVSGVGFGYETFWRIVQRVVCGVTPGGDLPGPYALKVVMDEFMEGHDDVRVFTYIALKRVLDMKLRSMAEDSAAGGESKSSGDKRSKPTMGVADELVRNISPQELTNNVFLLLKRVVLPEEMRIHEDGSVRRDKSKVKDSGDYEPQNLVSIRRSSAPSSGKADDEDESAAAAAAAALFDSDSDDDDVGANGRPKRSRGAPKASAPKRARSARISDPSTQRRALGNVWTTLMRLPLDPPTYRAVLLMLPENVMPFLNNPLMLADSLSDAYARGGAIALLALNGLFVLMTRHNLDHPKFFIQLYSLLNMETSHARYRTRFFCLLDEFMATSHLPAYLVAAFMKRLCRMALQAPTPVALFVLPFVYNLIKRHPATTTLIHREVKADAKKDPYRASAEDPSKSKAVESSLYELHVLKQHYFPDVAKLAHVFEQRMKRPGYDVEDFAEFTYRTLFADEMGRRIRTEVPVAIKPSRLMPTGDDDGDAHEDGGERKSEPAPRVGLAVPTREDTPETTVVMTLEETKATARAASVQVLHRLFDLS